MDSCDIGTFLKDECHQYIFTRPGSSALLKVSELSEKNKHNLFLRTGYTGDISQIATVCNHHHAVYVSKSYEAQQKQCCDPLRVHQIPKRKKLYIVSDELIEKIHLNLSLKIIPGKKLCSTCYKLLKRKMQSTCSAAATVLEDESEQILNIEEGSALSPVIDTQIKSVVQVVPKSDVGSTSSLKVPERILRKRKILQSPPLTSSSSAASASSQASSLSDHGEEINETLEALEVSPIKRKKYSSKSKATYAKNKISQASFRVTDKICKQLRVNPVALKSEPDKFQDCIIENIKSKLTTSSRNEKLSILTLLPDFWTAKRIASVFNVSKYLARKSKRLRKERGVMPKVETKKGKRLSEETVKKVIDFYESDEMSRMCPGMRESIWIRIEGEKILKQKRLMLHNLKDAFYSFKDKEPTLKIGLSKFCSLKPEWCICAKANGMHNVCVCKMHQNFKLMISALPGPEVTAKELMQLVVCDTDNAKCMIHRCKDCPGSQKLNEYLEQLLTDNEVDLSEKFSFKQWMQTDHTYLESVTVSRNEFLDRVVSHLNLLTKHHFYTKQQSKFYKDLKATLNSETALVVLDFSENYSFVVQDSVQGFHWNNSQATLHPFCIYYNEGDSIQVLSLCVVSDHMSHDAGTVRSFLGELVNTIKEELPQIKHLVYFSDGAGSQYKNCKNLINLSHHSQDLGLTAEWHFFATSHGKGPCDGVGGVVKRLAACASLQRPVENQILSPYDLFKWAKESIKGIKFKFVSTEEVCKVKALLEERMNSATTLKGTRNFHAFKPNGNVLQCASYSNSSEWEIRSFSVSANEHEIYSALSYVACTYDNQKWVGLILEVCLEESDYKIKFLHPAVSDATSNNFHWPQIEDICYVTMDSVLCKVSINTATGRTYSLPQKERKQILKKLSS